MHKNLNTNLVTKKINLSLNFIFMKLLSLIDGCFTVGILTMSWNLGLNSQQKQRIIYHCIHTQSGAHAASYPMNTKSSIHYGKCFHNMKLN